MKKSCGSCKHWFKWKSDLWGRGLCMLHDGAGKSDYGRNCEDFKRKKYARVKVKIETKRELEDE